MDMQAAYDPVSITSSPVGSDWGIELEGGQQTGKMKVNYDVALTTALPSVQLMGQLPTRCKCS